MKNPGQARILPVLLCCFALAACKQTAPVEFYGKIYVRYPDKILELSASGDPSGYALREIAGVNSFGRISPDGHYLLYATDSATFLRDLPEGSVKTVLPYAVNNASWSPDSKMFCYKTYWTYRGGDEGPSSDLFVYRLYDGASVAVYRGRTELYSGAGEVTESVDGMSWLSSKELLFQCGALFPERIQSSELWRDGNALRAENTVIATIGEPVAIAGCADRFWVRGLPADSSYILFSRSEFAYSPTFIDTISGRYFITDREPETTRSENSRINCMEGANALEINCRLYSEVGIIPGTSILYYIKDGEWNNKVLIFADPSNLRKKLKRSITYYPMDPFRFVMDPGEKMIAYFDENGLNIYDISGKQRLVIPEKIPMIEGMNAYASPGFGELLGWRGL